MYDRKPQNSVKQLSLKLKKIFFKNQKHVFMNCSYVVALW